MASGKRIVAVLFIAAFLTMSVVQASEGGKADVMPLAADDAGAVGLCRCACTPIQHVVLVNTLVAACSLSALHTG